MAVVFRKYVLALFLITVILSCPARGQEVVKGLTSNHSITALKQLPAALSKGVTDTLSLPFFDDFSYDGPFPDQAIWSDNYVFINNTFSRDQRTRGMATFDLLDSDGLIYQHATTTGFPADILTSNPIDLEYDAADSIYLTFLYQPGGLGDAPGHGDSLTVQFYAPDEESWYSVWREPGSETRPFRMAVIPVTSEKYLKKGFRFRFRAYGSLSSGAGDPGMQSSGDNWNIDYVKLDKGRSHNDTIMRDVAFTLPVRSLLNRHEAIPMPHYRQIYMSEMGTSIPVTYKNNDTITRNITRQFRIYDINSGDIVHSFSGGATNIEPGTTVNYSAPLFYTFPLEGTDTASYLIKSYIITDEFDPKRNDSITYTQDFANYFSFDDGTAEAGYGITGQGAANAMVAYRFRSYIPDSLRAISICFNHSHNNANIRSFDLMVWDNDNGMPGEVLYSQEGVMVEPGEEINGFHTYILDEPIYIDNIFFIGWRQRSETFLNAGADMNSHHDGRLFYWINGNWHESQIDGTVMIRAVTGPRLPSTGIDDIIQHPTADMSLYPNPASEIINVVIDDAIKHDATFTIFDIRGRVVMEGGRSTTIDISGLTPGVYIITAIGRNGYPLAHKRFIKAR